MAFHPFSTAHHPVTYELQICKVQDFNLIQRTASRELVLMQKPGRIKILKTVDHPFLYVSCYPFTFLPFHNFRFLAAPSLCNRLATLPLSVKNVSCSWRSTARWPRCATVTVTRSQCMRNNYTWRLYMHSAALQFRKQDVIGEWTVCFFCFVLEDYLDFFLMCACCCCFATNVCHRNERSPRALWCGIWLKYSYICGIFRDDMVTFL